MANVVLESLLVKRGKEQNRSQLIPKEGEPIFVTDTKTLYIGDGVTPGGVPVGALKVQGSPADGDLVVFDGTTGRHIKGVSKASLLSEYITSAALEARLVTQLQVKVNSAKTADDATLLNGRADYITADTKTNSYQENDAGKVVSAQAAYNLYQEMNRLFGIRDTQIIAKLDKASVVNSVVSTSTTSPVSANAVKQVYDLASATQQVASSAQSTAQSALTTASQAVSLANAAGYAPNLAADKKRTITISQDTPSGTPEEGTLWVQF